MIKKLIYATLLLVVTTNLRSMDLLRVEPAFWWVNMKNPQLQILVHAKDVRSATVNLQYPGVRLDSMVRAESPNYLFLYLTIQPDAKPGKFDISFTLNKKEVARYLYELKSRNPWTQQAVSYNQSDVIYLLMPDRFSNGNPSNDETPQTVEKPNRANPNGRHGGDIQGIINHLDYLKDLGVTTVWSTPLLEDNMSKFSYHTYSISNYYKIDPRYGTNIDYVRLADELHKRKMKLVMDMVPNHCSSSHWWMNDLPFKDWIHQFPEFTRSNYQISTTSDPYASKYDRMLDNDGWFDYSMPDLNQNNPLLLTYLTQNAIWWIEYSGVDGFRVDTYPYNDPWKIAQWTKDIRTEYPWFNIVGECWVHTPQEEAYWQSGNGNRDGYDSQLPIVMDFPLVDDLSTALNDNESWNSGLRKFYNHFALDFAYARPMDMLIFTENHDTRRYNEVIQGDIRKFKMAYALLFTIRGIPEFYYGSEIFMAGDKNKGDGDIRRDFPGGWPNDPRNAFTAEGRTPQENETFDFIRKLLNWRKDNPVIHYGKTTQFLTQDNCYVFFRYNNEKTVMVILNNDNTEMKRLDTKRFAERMNGFTSGNDVITGKKIDNLSVIEVPSKSAMIIELNK